MIAKLTVIFFIALCLMLGIFLTLFPWLGFGIIGDWGDNYLLTLLAQTTGLPVLQEIIASNWLRGAVTGLGILNLFTAFWEVAHFSQSVEILESGESKTRRDARIKTGK